jgi:hypothetical protein
VGGPSGVCNTGVRVEDLGEIWLLVLNELLQLCDLADLLECKDLILLVAINSKTSGVVAAVFESGKAIDESIENELPVLLHQVVDVSENTTVIQGISRTIQELKSCFDSRLMPGCTYHIVAFREFE